jgi:hypothetical protein
MMQCSLLSLGCVFGFAPPEHQAGLTALRALKIAQRRLRPAVRAKLLSVSSPKTNGSLAPEAWRFVFFDSATSGSSRVVTVAARASSEHPDTVEAFSSALQEKAADLQVIPQNKWLIDSDKALEKVRAESKLKGIRSVHYRLVQFRTGQEPCWIIEFFGEKERPVARFRVGAKSAELEMLDLKEPAGVPSVVEK